MIELQRRDHDLIDLTYEQQFVSVGHAQKYVFGSMQPRRQRERILELERAGVIRREECLVSQVGRIIRLTKSGVQIAESRRSEIIPQQRKLDLRTLQHDALVTAVRLRLSQLWDAHWIPERLIKAEQFRHIPDGVAVFESGTQIAIEVENSPKGPKRFREIQERWRGVPVKLCLYVASQAVMHRIVLSYLKDGPQDLPFALVSWDELATGTPKVWSVFGELDLFSRRAY